MSRQAPAVSESDVWITETDHDDFQISIRASRKLLERQSPYQLIELYDSVAFGKVLVLDGIIQLTEWDEYIYHEMLVHLPILEHGKVGSVLVIGGGDGCSAYRALMHPDVHVTQVEIDEQVVQVCKQHLGHLNGGMPESSRFKLVFGDGSEYLRRTPNQFDLIIVDSSDPVGPSDLLFSETFYQRCVGALTNHGVLVCQAGMPLLKGAALRQIRRIHSKLFEFSGAYLASVPTYVGGPLGFAWATNNQRFSTTTLKTIEKRFQRSGIRTKSYNPRVHRAAFCLPEDLLSDGDNAGESS